MYHENLGDFYCRQPAQHIPGQNKAKNDEWQLRREVSKASLQSPAHTAMEPAITIVHYQHLKAQLTDHTLQSEAHHQLFFLALFWG